MATGVAERARRGAPPARTADRPRAVVLGLDHVNGIQVARILSERGVPVIGVVRDPSHPCSRTRICERLLVTDTTGEPMIEALEDLAPSLPAKAVLFPSTDQQVLLISRHRERLERSYHVLLPGVDVVEMLMDKRRFYAFAAEKGLPIPPTAFLRDRSDAVETAASFRFPVVMKPPLSGTAEWERNSKQKAYRLSSRQELLAAYDRFAGLAEALIVQEWVAGPTRNLYSCNCYFDRASRPIATFVSRKVRQWPPETGESCFGQECRNDVVLEATVRLFELVGYHGLGYVEMKRDERTGEQLIMEPNVGRPTGRSPIAEAGGVELHYAAYCDAVGHPLPRNLTQRYGDAKWIYLRRDLQAALREWRRGELSITDWARSLRGPKREALFSARDPGPFLGDLQRSARLFLSAEERRKRRYGDALS